MNIEDITLYFKEYFFDGLKLAIAFVIIGHFISIILKVERKVIPVPEINTVN